MLGRPPPHEIYLDTTVLVTAIIRDTPHHTSCAEFCARLIGADSRIYLSQLVRVELPQAFRVLATKKTNLPAHVRLQHRLDDWGTDPAVRRAWLALGISEFEALLQRFYEAYELPWDMQIWQASLQIIEQYGLQSLDATHVATAQRYGLRDLAAVDNDFQRVPALDFWLIRNPAP
jgi:predicted nucleic acid-binding protein